MRALRRHGTCDIRCDTAPDPALEHGRPAIPKLGRQAVCGSDLHLFNGCVPGMTRGHILGHGCMGEVVGVGRDATALRPERLPLPLPLPLPKECPWPCPMPACWT